MERDKCVLITGLGLVGYNLAKKFSDEGYQVYVLEKSPRRTIEYPNVKVFYGSILDFETFLELSSYVDGIIHTAAIPAEEYARQKPLETFLVNVVGTLNALEVTRRKKLRRMIFCSTGAVYGYRPDLKPLSEDDPVSIISFYALTKYIGELLVEKYNELLFPPETKAITVRLSHVYGPGMFKREEVTYTAEDLWGAIEGKKVIIEAGDYPLNLTYVKDVCNAIFLIYTTEQLKHTVYNISSGKLYKLAEAAEIIKKKIPTAQIEIRRGTETKFATQAPIRGPLSIDRISSELGFKPEWDLEKGIEDYIREVRQMKNKQV